ncbi:IclR family transcriptional regulator [Microbacterium sp. NPDC078428]|uniref:IclR family transcriptional regulator n=1 Tax=Microbacterium sp. NPDC078428 TaxID=3364190 RepID=UPI0037CB41C6
MTERLGLEMINKTDAILTALDQHGELTAPRVAELVGEPVSSTYRLLTSLTAIGWVDKGSRRGLFRIGLFCMGIGGLVEDRIDIREAALPSMHDLIRTTGHTTYLCVRRDDRAVCIERLNGREVRSLAMRLGDSLPLYVGAAPKALFAFLPRSERDALVERCVGPGSPWGDVPSREALVQMTDETRERGYSISDGDVTPGIAALGAPLFNHRGELEASISISSWRQPILAEPDRMAAEVTAAAERISRALGFEAGRVSA